MSTFKALTYINGKSPLTWTTRTLAKLGSHEVLVKVKAVSVNPSDITTYVNMPSFLPCRNAKTMGGDFAGVIEKAGATSGWKPGESVFGNILDVFGDSGSFAEYVQVDPSKLLLFGKIPQGMTFQQAATLPMAGLTAFTGLQAYKGSLEGANVLVLGAGTTVGRDDIIFAKNHFKVKSIVATCSPGSAESAKNAGADIIVDYTKGTAAKNNAILEAVKTTGPFDIILGCAADDSIYSIVKDILKPASQGGIFCHLGEHDSSNFSTFRFFAMIPPRSFMSDFFKQKVGLSKYSYTKVIVEKFDSFVPMITDLWNAHQLPIEINSVYNIEKDYQKAIDKVTTGKSRGKFVLEF